MTYYRDFEIWCISLSGAVESDFAAFVKGVLAIRWYIGVYLNAYACFNLCGLVSKGSFLRLKGTE